VLRQVRERQTLATRTRRWQLCCDTTMAAVAATAYLRAAAGLREREGEGESVVETDGYTLRLHTARRLHSPGTNLLERACDA
jgi:hypothetical protein